MATVTKYSIDASGKTLGRVASTAAKMLMGKTTPDYVPNIHPCVEVTITNASKLRITEKKRLGKVYTFYSGYPGGLRFESLSMLIARKGQSEALRRAIQRMLPNNRLRVGRMKNLVITQ